MLLHHRRRPGPGRVQGPGHGPGQGVQAGAPRARGRFGRLLRHEDGVSQGGRARRRAGRGLPRRDVVGGPVLRRRARARGHSRPLDAAAARERRRGASEQIVLRDRVTSRNPPFDPGGVCASFLPNTSTPDLSGSSTRRLGWR